MPAGGPRSPFNCYSPNNARRVFLTSSVEWERPEWAAGAGGLDVEIDPVRRGGTPADFTYGDLRSGQTDSFRLDSGALTFIVIPEPSTTLLSLLSGLLMLRRSEHGSPGSCSSNAPKPAPGHPLRPRPSCGFPCHNNPKPATSSDFCIKCHSLSTARSWGFSTRWALGFCRLWSGGERGSVDTGKTGSIRRAVFF
jgi:hypothetical protein